MTSLSARRRLPYALAAAVVIAVTLWPGDVPWGGDDAVLIKAALRFNAARRPVDVGLTGSFGVPYGPLPAQIYQLLLMVTHDLATVVRLRAGLFAAVTLVGLFWLAKTLNVPRWLVLLPVVGPFFWFYSRLLWDNTFSIPIGTMMLAAYLSLWGDRGGRPWKFWFVAAGGAALPLIHPMTLPLVAAITIHGAVTRGRAVLQRWKSFLVVGCVTMLLYASYFRVVIDVLRHPPQPTSVVPTDYPPLSRPLAFAYPLLSGRLMSAFGFFDHRGFEEGLESSTPGRPLAGASALMFAFVGIGLLRGGPAGLRGWRSDARPWDAAAAVSMTALAFQCLLDGTMKIAPWPHYFCGTWATTVVLLWLGTSSKFVRPVAAVVGIATAVWTVLFAIDIHRQHGGAAWHGPTMRSQGIHSAEQAR